MSTGKKDELEWSERTIIEKARYLIQNTTVEPLLACYIIPSVLAQLATQNLNLEKACRVNLGYSNEVCTALEARQTENYTVEEIQVQQLVTGMSIWRTFLQSFIPAVLIMFLGSWSDRKRKRKPFMLIPIVGEFVTCMGLITCAYFFYELPMEVAGFVDSFFPSVTGGWMTMFMAVFSYMGDITTVEMRTLRIGVVNVFCSVGVPFGTALSGVLFKAIGFYGIFSISASIYVMGFMYGLFRIKEVRRMSVTDSHFDSSQRNSLDDTLNNERLVVKNAWKIIDFMKDFFDLQHIRETFAVAFKDGTNNRRKRVLLLIFVLMVVIGPMHGEMTVFYLFMRYRFNWDEVQFSMFCTYSIITHLIGTSFSVGVLSHLLKIDDALIGIMSCMSKILAGFMYAFARAEWQVYLAPLVDIVNGTSFIAMRSIASKLVPPEELGKLNSLYGACEALTPLLYGPMYAFVYVHTMDTMPGAFFILGGALTMPAVVIFGWMYTQHRGDRLRTQTSRKSSVAEDVLKGLRVEPLAITPTFLDPLNNQQVDTNGGKINSVLLEDLSKP